MNVSEEAHKLAFHPADLSVDQVKLKIESLVKSEALAAWIERAKRDKIPYRNEESAFLYYWSLTS